MVTTRWVLPAGLVEHVGVIDGEDVRDVRSPAERLLGGAWCSG